MEKTVFTDQTREPSITIYCSKQLVEYFKPQGTRKRYIKLGYDNYQCMHLTLQDCIGLVAIYNMVRRWTHCCNQDCFLRYAVFSLNKVPLQEQ